MLTARDVMIEPTATAAPQWTIKQVLELLLEEDISSLPIVEANGRFVGLVTESVLLLAAFDMRMQSDPVSLHMQRRFIEVTPDEPVDQLVEKFLLHRVRHFPVVENHRLLGIVTRRQMLRAVLGQKQSNEIVAF